MHSASTAAPVNTWGRRGSMDKTGGTDKTVLPLPSSNQPWHVCMQPVATWAQPPASPPCAAGGAGPPPAA